MRANYKGMSIYEPMISHLYTDAKFWLIRTQYYCKTPATGKTGLIVLLEGLKNERVFLVGGTCFTSYTIYLKVPVN